MLSRCGVRRYVTSGPSAAKNTATGAIQKQDGYYRAAVCGKPRGTMGTWKGLGQKRLRKMTEKEHVTLR